LFSRFFLILFTILITAAGGAGDLPRQHLIRGVPFVPQKRKQCGPAALAMVFGYYRIRISQEDLAEEINPKNLSGSLNLDLLIAARRHGFAARSYSGTLKLLKEYLARDVPVIALVNFQPDSDSYHFLVTYGFDDEKGELTVHSGRTSGGKLGYHEFGRAWRAADNWMLVVEQKSEWP
jgi:ABC-type bacteriocin/lantibiotic exporter with double-glycine peptidase domain